jgi:FKBP-type peptidyl-prolyl cis-trans isomerase
VRHAIAAVLCLLFVSVALADEPIPADTEIVTLPSGLKYSVLKAGEEGIHPALGDKVKVQYTGWLTDGKVFDSSRRHGQPIEFEVGQVIPGWNEALALMTKGARWKLTIPPDLAYGAGGRPGIPPNSTLIFDVELLEVIALPRFREGVPAAQKKTESGIVYEPLQEGTGDKPAPDDAVEIEFAVWNASHKLVECTERLGHPLQVKASASPVKFLAEAIPMLRPGSRYRFEVPAALAFGDREQGPDLPPNSPTVWEIQLVQVLKPLPVPAFEMSKPENVTTLPNGLQIETLREGDGATPTMGQEVTVHYAGWLTDGTLFDASYSRGSPTSFRLGRVIEGWNQGLQHMKVGGKVRLTIPAALAYGAHGQGKIPGNATLVFVVELLKVSD